MLFRYIGPDSDAPRTCVVYGYNFVIGGPPVEVADPMAVAKLQNNPCFRYVADEKAKAAEAPEETGMNADEARAYLETNGEKVDRRWGAKRLIAEAAALAATLTDKASEDGDT